MKGQRVISSFFGKKPGRGKAADATIQKQNGSTTDPVEICHVKDEDSDPPIKRQRITRNNSSAEGGPTRAPANLQPTRKRRSNLATAVSTPHASPSAQDVVRPPASAEDAVAPVASIQLGFAQAAAAHDDSDQMGSGRDVDRDAKFASTQHVHSPAAGRDVAADAELDCLPEHIHKPILHRNATRQLLAKRKLVESATQEKSRHAAAQNVGTATKYTPLEQQVVQLKKHYPGTVLIVEVGYKMRFFGEDAETASKVCNIYCYPDHNFLTASVPVLRLPIYVRRLVQAGYKVGVVRQTETAAIKATGNNKNTPFERKLTALYTASTLEAGEKSDKVGEEDAMEAFQGMEAALGSRAASRHLVCLAEEVDAEAAATAAESRVAIMAVETSTGHVFHGICKSGHVASELESELLKLEPSELILLEPLSSHTEKLLASYVAATPGCRIERKSGVPFLDDSVIEKVTAFYGGDAHGNAAEVMECDGSAASNKDNKSPSALATVMNMEGLMLRALSMAIEYLSTFGLQGVLQDVSSFRPLTGQRELALSSNAFRQLEVLQAGTDAKSKGSLLHLMDQTRTAMGARLLRSWLARPLMDRAAILQRQEAVKEMMQTLQTGEGPLCALEQLLRPLPDLEKGVTRMFHKTAAPAEFVQMLQALSKVSEKLGLWASLDRDNAAVPGVHSPLVISLLKAAASPQVHAVCVDLLGSISVKAAQQNNFLDIFMSKSRFAEVHQCKHIVATAQQDLQELLPAMARQAAVPRLEYVSVMNQGEYLIELPATRHNAPSGWEKVCSTKKVHRWHPPEVKQGIQALEVAKEHLQAACSRAWNKFLGDFAAHYSACKAAIQALAHLDVLWAFSRLAQSPGYCCPEFVEDDEGPVIDIKGGRHPMLDSSTQGGAVANDVHLAWSGCRSYIVTGPNMGGKSVFIRQTAVIVIMAQVGSFVPAESAQLHVVDGIFTRMGASDNLMLGRSTFQEELGDAADTLAKATSRSLVIMDELGRGTATHDGVAIAVACLEHLVATIGCLSLFVTHYPEVACLEQKHPGRVASFHMAYAQEDKTQLAMRPNSRPAPPLKVVFLYKLTPGIADQSFGLNVAHMAGLPSQLVQRAAMKASELQQQMAAMGHNQQVVRNFVKLAKKLACSLTCKDSGTSEPAAGGSGNGAETNKGMLTTWQQSQKDAEILEIGSGGKKEARRRLGY